MNQYDTNEQLLFDANSNLSIEDIDRLYDYYQIYGLDNNKKECLSIKLSELFPTTNGRAAKKYGKMVRYIRSSSGELERLELQAEALTKAAQINNKGYDIMNPIHLSRGYNDTPKRFLDDLIDIISKHDTATILIKDVSRVGRFLNPNNAQATPEQAKHIYMIRNLCEVYNIKFLLISKTTEPTSKNNDYNNTELHHMYIDELLELSYKAKEKYDRYESDNVQLELEEVEDGKKVYTKESNKEFIKLRNSLIKDELKSKRKQTEQQLTDRVIQTLTNMGYSIGQGKNEFSCNINIVKKEKIKARKSQKKKH